MPTIFLNQKSLKWILKCLSNFTIHHRVALSIRYIVVVWPVAFSSCLYVVGIEWVGPTHFFLMTNVKIYALRRVRGVQTRTCCLVFWVSLAFKHILSTGRQVNISLETSKIILKKKPGPRFLGFWPGRGGQHNHFLF
jgi:hypothetical protein